ncbi:MAG TPA: hypothetical protein VIH31_00965 [Candidatus Paceibacterota bacterium]
MKKLLFSLAMAVLAMMPFTANAQKPVYIIGELKFEKTDSIMVIKGVYEYFVRIVRDDKSEKVNCDDTPWFCRAFMFSLNDELYIEAKGKGKAPVVRMEGPYVEDVIQERLLRDYRSKLDKEEKVLKDEIAELKKTPEKEKKKDKKNRKLELKDKQAALIALIAEDKMNYGKLIDILEKAKKRKLGSYYSYNHEKVGG